MKFHTPSFILGFGSAVVVMGTARRLKPAVVEIGALGLHLARLGRAVVERQREHAEDLWAEVEERARHLREVPRRRRAGATTGNGKHVPSAAAAQAGSSAH
ncbi:hypothetical protein [Polyangium sorediatum]|uniref:Secreted protein n=1 Tax=Polyangium sorediatum TaxID=889274 RepID=A0ABT6P195_9BACT|nr:hypothetical protein [Polyangium sorediatum]MDI1434382.1 hypothetical protein [Polyangium sorediatum]